MAYEVFISHSHKDKAIADAICHYFENEGIKCWIAPRDITPGSTWAGEITRAIPQCSVFLLIFSSHANDSDQVLREVELAVKSKLVIVPVKIEDIDLSDDMEYFLSTVHWIDVVNKKSEKYILYLAETVKDFLKNKEKRARPPKGGKKKKRKPLVVVLPAVAVVILAILGILFKNDIFKNEDAGLVAAAETAQSAGEETPTTAPTSEPTTTPSPTATVEPTPTPTPTVDPDIALDTVVDIPDLGLKTIILKTLDDSGHAVEGNITVSDMLNLTEICLISPEAVAYDEMMVQEENPDAIVSDIVVESLEGLQYAKNLSRLVIVDNEVNDISALSQTYNLEYVNFEKNNISDISAFSQHGKITTLILCENDVEDITALQLLYRMETLDISTNPVTDLSPLSGMLSLGSLHINEMNDPDLDVIALLTKLQFLAASGSEFETKDLALLNDMEDLSWLILENNYIGSFQYWEPSDVLEGLWISGNSDFIDLSCLTEITSLKELGLTKTMEKLNPETIETLEKRNCEIVIR